MCGIAGIVSYSTIIDKSLLLEMRDSMIHRGPDGSGIWISNDHFVGLAHRRLSIVDLSESASQPMSNETDEIWIVFNGEIYNQTEIRNELSTKGKHRWKTDHSDTEVIIHAYEEWGINFICKLRGQFAIALWDSRKQEIFLIRDRSGIKPLYYSFFKNNLIFASEIKAILKDKRIGRKVNEEAFFHYLSFLATPAPLTLFDNIYKIPSGCYLTFSKSRSPFLTTYYDVLENINPLNIDKNKGIEKLLLNNLRDAVSSHKMSDVPVGIFLSGGVDSSTNAALFSEGDSRKVNTFTIGYNSNYQSYPDETPYAKKMADMINANYFEKRLSVDDMISFLPQMIFLQGEPIADPVCIPLYYVSKLARDNGVIVCQVGEGADELFHGYSGWQKTYTLQKNLERLPWVLKKGLNNFLNLTKYRDSGQNEYLKRSSINQPVFWGGAEHPSESLKIRTLSERLRKKFEKYSSWEAIKPYYDNFISKSPDKNILTWMTYIDLKYRLPELLLMRVDKMSMGASVETRVPFLDHKFIEFVLSIPVETRLQSNNPKYLLKKAVRGLVPDELIDRKKQGFGIPYQEWFADRLGEKMRTDVQSFLNNTDFFNKNEIINEYHKEGSFSWRLYNFVLWYNEFID
jgi:asparagine synthase (glutamine-hydrolysing)